MTSDDRTGPIAGDDGWLDDLLGRLDLAAKVRLLTGADHWELWPEPAIGLRALVMADGPSGVRGVTWDERDSSASLPSGSAVAASWDENLVARLAGVLASEARRKGVDVVLGPTVNLHRTPLAGRHFECFAEDPLLTGRLGVAYVTALQAHGVGACPKHYVCNDSETERFTLEVRIDERPLRELYLAPFERIVTAAGPWTVMAAYNAVNGPTMTENPLLDDPLKGAWAFDGVVVSDWFATRSTEAAGTGGLDLAMPGPDGPWGDALVEAVRAGRVSEAAIDDKARRLLILAARVGALDGVEPPVPARPPLPDAEVAAVAREAAAAGTVLLRNPTRILPVDPSSLRRVAVVGGNAVRARIQGGGSATVFPHHAISPLEGLRAALGDDVEVVHALGARLREGLERLDGTLATNPVTGEPGLHVRWLDADGAELRAEERGQGDLRWVETVPEGAAAVEAAARVRADVGGRWRLGVRALGEFEIRLEGEVVARELVTLEDAPFDAEVHLRQELAAEHDLAVGEEVLLEVRATVWRGAHGVGFTVGAERPVDDPGTLLAEAAEVARDADVVVVVVGTTEQQESEGFDRTTLALPGRQDDLVRAVTAANPRTVAVVNAGAPVELPWRDDVAALLVTWFGGQELGAALADVLLGRTEPGGRLPTTWPAREADVPVLDTRPVDGVLAYDEGLHVGHRAWARAGAAPAFHFGEGLGYTTWRYDALEVVTTPEGSVRARVTVTNVGDRRGKEVVQAYLARPDSAVERPVLWLAGFAVVRLDAGASTVVEVEVEQRAFEHWSVDADGWVLEPGTFELTVGRHAGDRPLAAHVTVG